MEIKLTKTATPKQMPPAAGDGSLKEAWCVGTAAVVCPIGLLEYRGEKFEINHNQIGEITQKIYEELTDIQWGRKEDPFGWTCIVH